MVVTVGIGILLELSMFRWKRNDTMGALLLSCGAIFVLQSVAIYFFGLGRMKTILPPYPGVIEIFYIDGLTIEYQRLIVFVATAGLLGLFWLFLHLTRLGAALRACASDSEAACQWRSKKGPPWRCKKGPLGGCGLVPVVHGRAPRATRRALNRPTRRRAREGPVGPRGQAWAGWSVQFAVGV